MPVPQRDWIDFVYAFAPAIAVFAAVIIGGVQLYLQRKQQQQDLFDKRFKVYEAATLQMGETMRAFGAALAGNGDMRVDSLNQFFRSTSHARFIFGADVVDKLRTISDNTYHLKNLVFQMKHPVADDLLPAYLRPKEKATDTEIGNRLAELLRSFEVLDRQVEVFFPYLQIHHDRWWLGRLFDRINRWMDSEVPAKLATRQD
jgi:Na+-transporting NADH:ubiquinone oxidoreductase subunit NqrC